MTPEDILAAQAILALCRAKLSGHEIDLLDRIANAETAEFSLTRAESAWFCSLIVEFAAEISLAADP